MRLKRREFLVGSLGSVMVSPTLPGSPQKTEFRVGVTDWNLRLSADPAAVAMAKACGFSGVQVALGRELVDGKLPLDSEEVQHTYHSESKKHGVELTSTCVDRLHDNYLKNDQLGRRWVSDAIRITEKLGLRVLLLPFFGDGVIEKRQEMDYVGDVLQDLAVEAEARGVILGIEDTVSAEDNVRIMERSRSEAVLTYYDIGNSTRKGFDVVKEIRWLGKDRICEIHIKDNPHYLGAGGIDIPAVVDAMADIGFEEWAVLETNSPSGDVLKDMRRNLTYLRGLIQRQNHA